jgi:hypothetical protein
MFSIATQHGLGDKIHSACIKQCLYLNIGGWSININSGGFLISFHWLRVLKRRRALMWSSFPTVHITTRNAVYSWPLNGLIPFGTSGLFWTIASTFSTILSSIFSIISNAVSCSSSCFALEHPRMTVPVFDIFAMYASASWMTPVLSSDWARAVSSRTFRIFSSPSGVLSSAMVSLKKPEWAANRESSGIPSLY